MVAAVSGVGRGRASAARVSGMRADSGTGGFALLRRQPTRKDDQGTIPFVMSLIKQSSKFTTDVIIPFTHEKKQGEKTVAGASVAGASADPSMSTVPLQVITRTCRLAYVPHALIPHSDSAGDARIHRRHKGA